jgi:microcystin-dependent protein
MSSPYVGEIRLFAFNFTPAGWAFCDGSLIQISQNPTLYNLFGTTYGGNGVTTFALPDLRSRVPMHVGPSEPIGAVGGAEATTLSVNNLPAHTHGLNALGGAASSQSPGQNVLASPAARSATPIYGSAAPSAVMASGTLGVSGSGTPISNIQPVLSLVFCISLFGVYPSQT